MPAPDPYIVAVGAKLYQLLWDGHSMAQAVSMAQEFAKATGPEIPFEDLLNIAQAQMEIVAAERVSTVSNQPNSSAPSASSAASAHVISASADRQHFVSTSSADISAFVDEFIAQSTGTFTTSELCQWCGLTDRLQRNAVSSKLLRERQKNKIERVGSRSGNWRRVESECEAINFMADEEDPVDIRLPFGLHLMVELMPGNIAIVAGEPNAGKTAFLLNAVRMNQDRMEVHYFNSEMGAQELKKRLSKFDCPMSEWRFNAWERTDNFHDAIRPGKGKLNIIDFLEVSEDFFKVGGMLKAIHDKLDGALAIVALQKNRGTDLGLGGGRSLEKPRLYLALEPNKLKIVKAKNWKTDRNPNGLERRFKTVNGCDLRPQGEWQRNSAEDAA
ncbi:DnaB-like helicase C-terminal domain-containing protein [Desulfovibrio sp. Fe33]|uniref:DnaB-like helicase C-terminal domain-containing protein n=1 Tax=Desulfovibrio sp. Fe33 TaxID=3020842 RepID=UPI00234C56BC|nr:DnaB-like helicase C-terminal domain-containing protein [Desulfovibrio sp. Fe33]